NRSHACSWLLELGDITRLEPGCLARNRRRHEVDLKEVCRLSSRLRERSMRSEAQKVETDKCVSVCRGEETLTCSRRFDTSRRYIRSHTQHLPRSASCPPLIGPGPDEHS